MKIRAIIMIGIMMLLAGWSNSTGQVCGGERAVSLDVAISAEEKKAVLDSIEQTIRERYLYPDKVDKLLKTFSQKTAHYKDELNAMKFASTLTTDLREITDDLHFGVLIQPKQGNVVMMSCGAMTDSASSLKNSNYGFRTVKHLTGNVGYLEMTMFADTAYARPTAEAAMRFLAGSDALIIDLRSSNGGYSSIGQLIAGYFLAPGTELHTRYSGIKGETGKICVIKPDNAETKSDLPVYILTAPGTASAAEAFAYDLKHLGRARVIGEKTIGAGHCANLVNFDFPEFTVEFMLPVEEPIHPVTKSNWEGTGVIPDTEIKAADALAEAHRQALEFLADKTADPDKKTALEWAEMSIKMEYNHLMLSPDKLAEYTGDFGPRHVALEDGHLVYDRDDLPTKYELIPLDDDLFALDGVDIMRLRFDRDDVGNIVAVTGIYDIGYRDNFKKDSPN